MASFPKSFHNFAIRACDLFAALTALIFLLPLFIVIIVTLSVTGEHEIFYVQKRIGINKKPFGVIKFATMLKNSPNMSGGTLTIHNDKRILPFGSFLRKTKINELPQLLNVVIGNMSLVGPRPQAQNCFLLFSKRGQKIITTVKPGLTGLGSLFFRNEETLLLKDNEPLTLYAKSIVPYKEELERWYIQNASIHTYLKVIFLTVIAVFFKRNVKLDKFFIGLPPIPEKLKNLI